jgi:hypothetical protein
MGACFDSAFINDPELKLTNAELRKQAEEVFEHSAYMNGHGGYSGSLAEKTGNGITIHRDRVCKTKDEAWEVMDEYDNDKWGPAECIPVTGEGWAIGGYCSS